jgi:spore coat polysaccharide biosynthesis protein SpsF (cytidylyltransferase family)
MTKYLASIQVRLNSSRLPKKALEKIAGFNSIEWMILRLEKSDRIDKLVVATTTSEMDNPIEDLCKSLKVDCFRGSEEDVLNRISQMLKYYDYENHLEFYGDSPFPDPNMVDDFILKYEEGGKLFLSNTHKTTYPPGFEIIIYKASELIDLEENKEAANLNRSHCGVNLLNHLKDQNPKGIELIEAPDNRHFPELHFELDTQEDLETLNAIVPIIQNEHGNFFSIDEALMTSQNNIKIFSKNNEVKRRYEFFRK